jgi:hypothetical protein
MIRIIVMQITLTFHSCAEVLEFHMGSGGRSKVLLLEVAAITALEVFQCDASTGVHRQIPLLC